MSRGCLAKDVQDCHVGAAFGQLCECSKSRSLAEVALKRCMVAHGCSLTLRPGFKYPQHARSPFNPWVGSVRGLGR